MPVTTFAAPAVTDAASWSQQCNGRLGGHVGSSAVDVFDPRRLREARTSAGLTQRDVAIKLLEAARAAREDAEPVDLSADAWARAVETERVRVNTYEQGSHTPRAVVLRRLAQAVGVDAFDLFRPDTPRTLATLRSRLGLTQADVAARLSVGRAYYSRVEQGRAVLHDPADVQALADVLEADAAEVGGLVSAAATA